MPHAEQPTHVLMTADAVGGVWTYAVELCRELNRVGIKVTLAVLGPRPSAQQQEELSALRRVTVHTHPCRLEWMEDPWTDVAEAGEWLLALEDRTKPDLIHLNGYCHGMLPWQAPCLVVGHSCVQSWWQAVHGEPAPASWNRYASHVREGVSAAAAVVAPTRTMLEWLEELYGPLRRGHAILNGRSVALPEYQKEPLLLSAGRLWDQAKNVAALCDVAPCLPWPVAVAGSIGEAKCRPDAVRYLGRLTGDEVQHWMARASIYVLPARYEPFGLSVLEAALAGCALVLGDIPTLHEIWGDAAVYVKPDDRAALQTALTSLIDDEGRRSALAAAARSRAAALTPERMADHYRTLYSELMRERRTLLSLSAV